MQTLILSSGGLKSAFLIAVAQREDNKLPLLLHFANDTTAVGKMGIRATTKLAQHYDCDILSIPTPEKLFTPLNYLNVLHSLIHALPIARHYECYRIFFGWSRDNWREQLHLHEPNTVAAFLHATQQLLTAIQTVYTGDEYTTHIPATEVEMPFYLLPDDRIVYLGDKYAVPWQLTYDCEKGNLVHCGECKSCIQRQIAFEQAELEDETVYRRTV